MSNRFVAVVVSGLMMSAVALAGCSKKEEAPPVADALAESSAASQAVDSPDVKVFAIGELQAMALRDGGLDFPNDNKVLGVGRTPEEVAAVVTEAGLASDKLSLSIQPLLVKAGERVLLFDTGASGNFGPAGGKLPASMSAAGVDPLTVTDIFISHAHGDHVGGLVNAAGELAFPNASIHISAPEWAWLKDMKPEMAAAMGFAQHGAFVAAIAPKVAEFAPGSDLVPGVVRAVDVKGHTPGHSAYLITSGQSSLLYVGDSVHHHVVSVQKPEWTIAFDGDAPVAQASRAELIARSAESGQRIYAVHFPWPGIGKFERREGTFVWVPE